MRRLLISTLVVATAFGLAGCSVSPSSTESAPDFGAPAPAMEPGMDEANRDVLGEVAYGDGDVKTTGGQQVITHGSLRVTVADPVASADDVSRIVTSAGGHVESRNEFVGTPGTPGRADLTLRIPANRLDSVLDSIKELGEARDNSITSTDVTQQSRDIAARITALETSVDRLLDLLERADDTDTLITIEQALSQRQAELEGLKAQKRYLDDQVAMSTITVALVAERDAPIDDPENFWTGLQAGWDAFVGFWATALIALGVLAPWLALIAVIVLVVIVLVKRASRKSHVSPSESATTTTTTTPMPPPPATK